jgi:hypothetical protein
MDLRGNVKTLELVSGRAQRNFVLRIHVQHSHGCQREGRPTANHLDANDNTRKRFVRAHELGF